LTNSALFGQPIILVFNKLVRMEGREDGRKERRKRVRKGRMALGGKEEGSE
jgi:hypothetical protein